MTEIAGHFDGDSLKIHNLGYDMVNLEVIVDELDGVKSLTIRLGQTERQKLIAALQAVTLA